MNFFFASIYWEMMLLILCFISSWFSAAEVPPMANCPNDCSGHGNCNKFGRCTCNKGYEAADCSDRICPFGNAWSDVAIAANKAHNLAECSNRGLCDRATGNCNCMEGFTGAACERLACPNNCNNRGRCFSMKTYAANARDENAQQYEYTNIWDAEKIQGCVCDYPATGYDCSYTLCPRGDDPLTTIDQSNDVQLIVCKATTGSFVLYYQGLASGTIPYNANAFAVTQALKKIPALKTGVKVSFSLSYGTVCQLQSNVISIEFTQQFGEQLPLVPEMNTEMQLSGASIKVYTGGVCK
jgi:hypothetical protein